MVKCCVCGKEYKTHSDMLNGCYFVSPWDEWTWEWEHVKMTSDNKLVIGSDKPNLDYM